MKYDSIIFNLDGTLWDAVSLYRKAWNGYFEKSGLNRVVNSDDIYTFLGLYEKSFLLRMLPEYDYEKRINIYNEVQKIQDELILKEGARLYDGLLDGIKKLSKKYKLFIVSNSSKNTVKNFLKYYKLTKYFTEHVAHGENSEDKRYNLKYIISHNRLQSPIYIGDTNHDFKCARLAKVHFILADYGFGKTKMRTMVKKVESSDELISFLINME